jgi:hypothetical protein
MDHSVPRGRERRAQTANLRQFFTCLWEVTQVGSLCYWTALVTGPISSTKWESHLFLYCHSEDMREQKIIRKVTSLRDMWDLGEERKPPRPKNVLDQSHLHLLFDWKQVWLSMQCFLQPRPNVPCMEVCVRAHNEVPSLCFLHSNAQLCLLWSQSSDAWRTRSWMCLWKWRCSSWGMSCSKCYH